MLASRGRRSPRRGAVRRLAGSWDERRRRAREVTCHFAVVTEGRRVQRGVASVDMGETLGEKELVASLQPGRGQRWASEEKAFGRLVFEVPYRDQQAGETDRLSHVGLRVP
jgi:hypothetical protein